MSAGSGEGPAAIVTWRFPGQTGSATPTARASFSRPSAGSVHQAFGGVYTLGGSYPDVFSLAAFTHDDIELFCPKNKLGARAGCRLEAVFENLSRPDVSIGGAVGGVDNSIRVDSRINFQAPPWPLPRELLSSPPAAGLPGLFLTPQVLPLYPPKTDSPPADHRGLRRSRP